MQVWDESATWSRRILRIEQQKRGRLTLAVEKFARREGFIDLIDRARPATYELAAQEFAHDLSRALCGSFCRASFPIGRSRS